jgi:hypothetical protein
MMPLRKIGSWLKAERERLFRATPVQSFRSTAAVRHALEREARLTAAAAK